MALGIAGFVKEIEKREERKVNDISVEKTGTSKKMDTVENIMPELYKLEKDPAYIKSMPGEALSALCRFEVLDISINERGLKLMESFKTIEQITSAIPKQETEGTEKLADKVDALPETDESDVEIQYKKAAPEKRLPKSVYLIETPRKEEDTQELPEQEEGKGPLIPPRKN